MATRAEIAQRLDWVRFLNKQEPHGDDLLRLNSAVSDIIKSRYFPFLAPFLSERMTRNLGARDYPSYVLDGFISLSPLVRQRSPDNVFLNLMSMLRQMITTTINVTSEYLPLFPIVATVCYDLEKIVAGNKPSLHFTLSSKLSLAVVIDSVAVAVSHDQSAAEEIVEVAWSVTVDRRLPAKFSSVRSLPPAIKKESVKAVVLRFANVWIRMGQFYCRPLHVSPDASACLIEWRLPKRCVIGAAFPLSVMLRAADQRLEHVQMGFNVSAPVTLSGRYGDADIASGKADLPNIDPGGLLELQLSVKSSQEFQGAVEMVVSFGTALSGEGEFVKPIHLDILGPFKARMRFFDTAYQELDTKLGLSFESGSYIVVETTMTNVLECAITVLAVEGSLVAVEAGSLPAVVGPDEAFTFLGRITKPGQEKIIIHYEAELVGRCPLYLHTPAAEQQLRTVTFALDSPPTGVRYQKFKANVTIKKMNGKSPHDPEVSDVVLEIQAVPGFYIDGPTKKSFVVFAGQKIEIPIAFLPLEAGPTTLPPITLTEIIASNPTPKRFLAPIVITFQ
jgi:hypothetical protein